MQCGTILSTSGISIEVHPPRQSGWKKPFRKIFRFFRLTGLRIPSLPPLPVWVSRFFNSGLLASVFSIIPGLAQLLNGQLRSIVGYWIAWIILIGLTILLWGTPVAAYLFSLALSVHVWIAMRGGLIKEFTEFRQRMICFLILGVVYGFIYYHGSQIGLRLLGLQGGYSLANLPSQNIESGHYFWGRTQNLTLKRGDFVYTTLRGIGNHGMLYNRNSGGFVRIIGLPNETLTMQGGVFRTNDQPLDRDLFPVPTWLARINDYRVILGEDQYFVVAEFQGQGYNAEYVNRICILTLKDFQAKAFLRWPPWRNRGFIESNL